MGRELLGRKKGLYANRPLTGFSWAGPLTFDQVKRVGLYKLNGPVLGRRTCRHIIGAYLTNDELTRVSFGQ